jgi:UDP-N-acetyl-D-mannosaminuronic acid dehydrogenase
MKTVVVGGCGHVGLPLGLALASAGLDVVSLDINQETVDVVNSGKMPFLEPGTQQLLERAIRAGTFRAESDPASISMADNVIVVIGTPVDEHLNPDPDTVIQVIEESRPFLRDGQLLVLRSTIFPGVTAKVQEELEKASLHLDVAFCPERIAEGFALEELGSLPQIVGAYSDRAFERAAGLFATLGAEPVRTTPEEAELAKLFTNAWRYIKFAIANQFYEMAQRAGVDYENVRHAITYRYPRANDLPKAGFAAGPCLLKDTMQLAAFSNNAFPLGHSAMLVNEGLPLFMVEEMEREFDLKTSVVGVLGMAFKGDSDDPRSSLSYKLRRILKFRAKEVLSTDPYIKGDGSLLPLETVLKRSDVLVIATPHSDYRGLQSSKPVVDIWRIAGKSER